VIKSLTLVDFMAHARTTLELAPGLNVLCGPNNTGKSAVVEALRCLVTNPSPRHVIRHGASEARVEALLDSGHKVCWVRRKNYAIYEVFAPGAEEPETYAKLGKSGVPEDVAKLLKLSPVSFEKGQEVDVHLGDQRHPIFLLDQPGSLLADFLASSTESAHLMAMQDLLRDKVRGARKGLKGLEEAVDRAESGLDGLAALPEFSLGLERLGEQGRELEAEASAIPRMEARLSRLRALGASVEETRARSGLLEALSPPPAPEPSAALSSSLTAMDASRRKAASARAVMERLAPLAAPPVPGPSGRLAGTLEAMRRAEAVKEVAARRLDALSRLAPPPPSEDPAPLAGLVDRIETLAARVEKGKAWMAAREKELEDMAGRIAARLGEVGECPLCGSSMDADKFLRKADERGSS